MLRGLRSLGSGVVPPDAGVYVTNTIYINGGDADATVLQGQAQIEVEADAVVDIIQPTLVYPFKLGGLTVASSASLPISDIKLSGTLTSPLGTRERTAKTFGVGDLVLSPVVLGYHSKKFHASATVSLFLPTGEYDADEIVNAGRNSTSVAPSLAVSYINPQSGWDVSLAGSYVFIGRNDASDYDSGDLLQFDVAIGKQLDRAWKVGVAGYGVIQTTDDSGTGARFGAFHTEVFGIGPVVNYGFLLGKQPLSLSVRYYHEFGARNTFEGDSLYLGLSTKL